jgi:glomulin
MVIDMLSMDLPKVVSMIGTLSEKCHQIAKSIIELFVSTCNPRDMIPVLCEVWIMQIILSLFQLD